VAREIPDAELQPQDVPRPEADWLDIWRFALTTDGYARLGTFEAVAELGNSAAAAFARDGTLPKDLQTLRLALFFEQRRYHHLDGPPGGTDAQYIRALVRAIGNAVGEARRSST